MRHNCRAFGRVLYVGVLCAPDASQCVQRWGTAEQGPGESVWREGWRGGGTVQGCSVRPDIFQIPRRGLLPLTSASCGCEGRWCRAIWPGRCAGWTDVFQLLSSLAGLCNMAKHRISAYLTLQPSPVSKVRDDKQEAKCKAIKTIRLPRSIQNSSIKKFEGKSLMLLYICVMFNKSKPGMHLLILYDFLNLRHSKLISFNEIQKSSKKNPTTNTTGLQTNISWHSHIYRNAEKCASSLNKEN